jgi:hypothetical protein
MALQYNLKSSFVIPVALLLLFKIIFAVGVFYASI